MNEGFFVYNPKSSKIPIFGQNSQYIVSTRRHEQGCNADGARVIVQGVADRLLARCDPKAHLPRVQDEGKGAPICVGQLA